MSERAIRTPGTWSVTRHRRDGQLRWQGKVVVASGERKSVGVFATREEGERAVAAFMLELQLVEGKQPASVALKDWGTTWLRRREVVDQVRGIVHERRCWKRHVAKSSLGLKPLVQIEPSDVAAFVDQLVVKNLSPLANRGQGRISRKTAGKVLSLIKLALRAAVSAGFIKSNPAADIKIRKVAEVDDAEPWTYLLPEEPHALFTCEAIPLTHRLWMQILCGTGLRLGEFNAVKLRDVRHDDADPHLVVRRSNKGTTKSGKIRRVPLFGMALEAMQRWLELLPAWCPRNPFELAFPGPRGARRGVGVLFQFSTHRRGKAVKVNPWNDYLAAAGIVADKRHDGRRPRPAHDFRHTCAASLVSGWYPLQADGRRLRTGAVGRSRRSRRCSGTPRSRSRSATRTLGKRPSRRRRRRRGEGTAGAVSPMFAPPRRPRRTATATPARTGKTRRAASRSWATRGLHDRRPPFTIQH